MASGLSSSRCPTPSILTLVGFALRIVVNTLSPLLLTRPRDALSSPMARGICPPTHIVVLGNAFSFLSSYRYVSPSILHLVCYSRNVLLRPAMFAIVVSHGLGIAQLSCSFSRRSLLNTVLLYHIPCIYGGRFLVYHQRAFIAWYARRFTILTILHGDQIPAAGVAAGEQLWPPTTLPSSCLRRCRSSTSSTSQSGREPFAPLSYYGSKLRLRQFTGSPYCKVARTSMMTAINSRFLPSFVATFMSLPSIPLLPDGRNS